VKCVPQTTTTLDGPAVCVCVCEGRRRRVSMCAEGDQVRKEGKKRKW